MSDLSNRSFCPHCGGALNGRRWLEHPLFDDQLFTIRGVPASPVEWRLLSALRERYKRFVPIGYLCMATASDAAEPVSAATIRVYTCHLRRLLAGSDLTIATRWGFGYGLMPRPACDNLSHSAR